MPRSQAEDHLAGELRVGGDNRPGQATPAACRQFDRLRGTLVAHDRADRAERLHLMRLRSGWVVAVQEQGSDERAALGASPDDLDVVRVPEYKSARGQQGLDGAADLLALFQAGQ